MIQDDSCLVVSQNYQDIESIFLPCLSEHPRTVMNSILKNRLSSGNTNTKNNINYIGHDEFEESAVTFH